VRFRRKDVRFGDVNVVLVEQNPQVLKAFHHGLRERGFSKAVGTRDLGELEDCAAETLVDLVICDTDGEHEDFPAFNKLVRQGGHGQNPYAVTIGVTENPTEANIKRVFDAGVDNILLKPLSMNALLDRLSAILMRRKAFVVASDYIGPDRRIRPRQELCLPLIDVPNTLKERLDGTYDEARIRKEIAAANQLVNRHRATQDAVLINQIVSQIAPCYDAGEIDDAVLMHLHRLVRTVHDIVRRMENAGDKAIGKLSKSMIPILEKLISNHLAPDISDIRQMQNLATSIFMAYGTEEKAAELSSDSVMKTGSEKRKTEVDTS